MFRKEERSTFKYWFAHWCAFQMTALNLKCWKPKYLLHDIEKPWLKLIWKDYSKVQKYHRTHSNHHIEYYVNAFLANKKLSKAVDWEAMLIDFECSHYTKEAHPLLAYDTIKQEYDKLVKANYGITEKIQYMLTDNTKGTIDYNICAEKFLDFATDTYTKLFGTV